MYATQVEAIEAALDTYAEQGYIRWWVNDGGKFTIDPNVGTMQHGLTADQAGIWLNGFQTAKTQSYLVEYPVSA